MKLQIKIIAVAALALVALVFVWRGSAAASTGPECTPGGGFVPRFCVTVPAGPAIRRETTVALASVASRTADLRVEAGIPAGEALRVAGALDRAAAQVERAFGRSFSERPRVLLFATPKSFAQGIEDLFVYPSDVARTAAASYGGAIRSRPASNPRKTAALATQQIGIHAYLPAAIVSHRKNAAYLRVVEAGLLALLALMLLTLVLARPLLRAFSWTEEQASEARIDALTGLANRRALEEILAAEISRAQRFAHQLAVVLLDLDRFKEINDSFGHAAGDVMLRAVSRLLTSLARQGDTVARWGGEEFVVVLPETDLAGAQRFAERLRRTIEAHAVGEMKTSASCGVATMLPEDSVEELLGAADQALYQAKSNGRNRTESAIRGPRPAAA